MVEQDINSLLGKSPLIPASIEEVHQSFTHQTKHGEKLAEAALLDPVYNQIKEWISRLHDSVIRTKIHSSLRSDMSFETHYEEVRLRLALRPLVTSASLAKAKNLKADEKEAIQRILALQPSFNWLSYTGEEEKNRKAFREKLAGFDVFGSLAKSREKLAYEKKMFLQDRNLWISYFDKLAKAVLPLQQGLRQLDYGRKLHPDDQKIIRPLLADVQARALESIEKMIWVEMQIVLRAELLYQQQDVLRSYSNESD